VRHGEWLPWLEANFDADPRTAQTYMRLAANATRVSHLGSVREAVALLAAPKQQEPADVGACAGLITRANVNAYNLREHVEHWGLVLGALPEAEAFERLQETERDIAEVKRALREASPEQMRDVIARDVIDNVQRTASRLHEARQTMDKYGARSLSPMDWTRDALQQMAEDTAALIALVNDAIAEEGAT
jgi:hypothetical protein